MTNLRATVIMKTDISGSTVRFRALAEADLHALLMDHREFVGRHAAAQGGHVVKPEGDGFWLVFPSVTAAALAAMAMQEGLWLAQPNRAADRLAMRVVIALGDVLHEEGALIGEAVAFTTRIESITPPDEIYLSAAAKLLVNQAEVRTAFVDTFPLKGFPDPVPVYRVEQTHRTRIIANEYIVFTDLRGFSRMTATAPMTTIETILESLFGLANRVTREFDGVVRFGAGDAYCLTFPDAARAMAAAERLCQDWDALVDREQLVVRLNVAMHQGMLYAFRSFLYGPGIEIAANVENASKGVMRSDRSAVFLTGQVRSALGGTIWENRLELVDARPPRHPEIEIYRLSGSGTS